MANREDDTGHNEEQKNGKTKLYTFQIETNLLPVFSTKVEEQFGRYKKSKVLNALIKGYVDGKYTVKSVFDVLEQGQGQRE